MRALCQTLSAIATLALPFCAFAEPQFTIGVMAELSGASASNGELCRQGVEVARSLMAPHDKIGGYNLRFVFGDTQGQGPAGISEFKRLVDSEGALAVVTTRSQVAMAVNPVSQEKGVALFGVVGHADFLKTNRFAYRFWPTAEQEGAAIAQRLRNDGIGSVALLTTEDQWTQSLSDNFSREFAAAGGLVALSATLDPADSDFSTIITKVRASKAQAVLFNLTLAHMGVAIKRAKEAGLAQKMYANYWVNNPATREVAGDGVRGVVYAEPNPDYPEFVARLAKLFDGARPLASQYTCYLATGSVLKVLATNAKISSAADFIGALKPDQRLSFPDGELVFHGRNAQIPIRFQEAGASIK